MLYHPIHVKFKKQAKLVSDVRVMVMIRLGRGGE